MSPHQCTRASRGGLIAAVALLLFLLPSPAPGVDHDWVNSAGGFFQTTTNWDPVGVPGAADRAIFSLNGAYTVGFFGGRDSSRLLVGRDNVTFDLNNSSYVLDGAGGTSLVVGLAGPLGGAGRLTIGEGTVAAQAGQIGTGSGSLTIGGAGTVTVTTGGALRFANALTVGSTRAGNVIVNGGGDLFTVNTTVGLGGAGSATVAGTDSRWIATSWIVVGGTAGGAMNVTGGGIVAQSGAGAQGVVGDQSSGSGAVNIDGAGSRWSVPAELYLGNAGDATVNLTSGGQLTATAADTVLANTSTSASTVTVGGGDAALVTRSLTFGAGTGTVNVNAGGRVQTAATGALNLSATGWINLAGGLLHAGSVTHALPNRINWTSGTLHLNTGSVLVHSSGLLGNNVAIGAGTTLRMPDLHVGGGSLTLSGGGAVENARATVGENFNANGTVAVSGPGSTWTVNDLTLGNFGHATLTITGGGSVINNSANTFGIEVAAASISTSRVTVDGAGSTWDASTIPTAQGFVRIGSRGNGALEITNGGTVRNDFTHAYIGSETGSTGNALVSGTGSAWDVGYILNVGHMGSGSLTVLGGGTVSADTALVGYAITGRGTLALAGAGSRLDVGTLNVAHAGHATVTINAGATIDGQRTVMSTDALSNAFVHVNGGTLRAGLTTAMNRNARLQYDAGTFQAGTLQMSGAARVTLSAGRNKIVETHGLSIDAAGGSRIDLADNFLVVDYMMASPIENVKDLIVAGYSGGGWSGNGITSSLANASTHGIGYVESSDVFTSFPATFAGRSVDGSTVLVAYARYGDANLDGVVNLADFNRLAANFGSTGGTWSRGDFDYDGSVNLQDFNRLAANFGMSASGIHAPTPADWAMLATRVPEPGASVGVALALSMMVARRRLRIPS